MNGMIDWFARNPVAANLLMAFIIVSGLIGMFNVRGETFPEIELDIVSIQVPYLGAAPEEVEEGVNIRIEEAIQGIDGIEQITSTANEGSGTVMVEVALGAETRRVLDDIKTNVDAIETFPEQTEKPIITEVLARFRVVDIAVSGDTDEFTLKSIAERVRDDLAALPGISLVEFASARPYEISIEVSEDTLRRHGLTFDDVSNAVRRSSLDLPGGSVRSESGEILLRTIGQAYRGAEFENLVLMARPDGTRLHLGDVATVVDGFAETDQFGRFDGKPTILVSVFRSGDQSDMEIARAVEGYMAQAEASMPEGITLTVWMNQAEILIDRLSLMLRNGAMGFALVFVMLALFLELRLAFWVSLGIPISFLGTLMLMPGLDITANVVTTFAFIMVLGIVVDAAIIVGENIHRHQQHEPNRLRAAISGAQEIATPVTFAVLTTVAAFSPLLFVPGMMGKMMIFVPLIVIPCLLFSLVECLQILPAHLAHLKPRRRGLWRWFQSHFAEGLEKFIDRAYRPALAFGLRWRYLSLAVGVSTLIVTGGMVAAGWVAFQFFPSPEASVISASITMPLGTAPAVTSEAVQRVEDGAARLRQEVLEQTGVDVVTHVYAAVGEQPMGGEGPGPLQALGAPSQAHLGQVMLELAPPDERPMRAEYLNNRWRELTGPIPEATELSFSADEQSAGSDVDVMLVGPDVEVMQAAADRLKQRLRSYAGVYDVTDSFLAGKDEIKLGITPAAESLGLTLQDLGRQVRQAFYGEETQRIQRGRDDIRVMVRYPADERRSLGDLEGMRIRTPDGGEVPFGHVAVVEPGQGFASIKRVDRNRAINVLASIDENVTTSATVNGDLAANVLPALLADYPGVRYAFEGVEAEQRDAIGGLQIGFTLAMFGIFALLAIPLKSYIQPLIIMSAIPFGFVGAVWGHIIMGENISMMSTMGIVALSGVVVNDSLVLVDFINRARRVHSDVGRRVREAGGRQKSRHEFASLGLQLAISEAGSNRFRPILLTSLTTFAGLAPLLLEQSTQADFLKPMAISLAFGVIFATFVTLVLVPTIYLILEDIKWVFRRLLRRPEPDAETQPGQVLQPAR
ncbi:MAG: efflux RND transporter permease subunit [Acidobacteria bacterium]|nr:efflux RND transporter permease subunit [Acidobacteriota bacterium]